MLQVGEMESKGLQLIIQITTMTKRWLSWLNCWSWKTSCNMPEKFFFGPPNTAGIISHITCHYFFSDYQHLQNILVFLKPCSCKCISTSPYLSDNLFSDTQRCTVRLPPQISNWGWSSGHATACKRIGVLLRVTKVLKIGENFKLQKFGD